MNQASSLPTRKVGSGLGAGAIVTIVLWVVNTATGVEVPPEVAAAITTILAFITSYFVQETPVATTPPSVTPPVEPPADGGGVVGPPDQPL